MNPWYVLYCKVQDIDKIARRAGTLGATVYCPRYQKLSRRSDCSSYRKVEKYLFPNYLFLSFDINILHTSAISSIPGAVGFIHCSSSICSVPSKVILAIQKTQSIISNSDNKSIDCRNIPPDLILQIQSILQLNSADDRQVALSRLVLKPVKSPQ